MMKSLSILLLFVALTATCAIAQTPKPQYVISVTRAGIPLGDITIELFPDVAPKHVRNFDSLVGVGFYDGTAFHRVIPGFMIQGGGIYSKDPDRPMEEWGISDPSQTRVPAEFSTIPHTRGIISMARLGNDTNSGTSQFFICVATASHLDGSYSVFGRVVSGMDVVDTIVMSDRHPRDNYPYEKVEMRVVAKGSASVPADAASSGGHVLFIRPNPSTGPATIEFRVGSAGVVHLRLFDSRGREVATILDERRDAGGYSIPFNGNELSSGSYTVQMQVGDEVLSRPLVLVR